jgi:hypothetical protein
VIGNLAQDIPWPAAAVCEGHQLRLTCAATGHYLRWNDSPGSTFTSHDEIGTPHVLVDQNHKFVTFLVHKHYFNGELQFISELHSLDTFTVSSNITVSCNSDTSASSLPIIVIAGTYSCTMILYYYYQLERELPLRIILL